MDSVTKPIDCGPTHFYQQDTRTCEPCSVLCDPPGVYETDCPRLCPHYVPTSTTTTPLPESADVSNFETAVFVIIGILILITIVIICCVVWRYGSRIIAYLKKRLCGIDGDVIVDSVEEQGFSEEVVQHYGNTTLITEADEQDD